MARLVELTEDVVRMDAWEHLPRHVRAEVEALRDARRGNPLGVGSLGSLREFCGMLKEALAELRDQLADSDEVVAQAAHSAAAFVASQEALVRHARNVLEGGRFRGAADEERVATTVREVEQAIAHRQRWLATLRDSAARRRRAVEQFEAYTARQVALSRALEVGRG
jgi:ABC-type transporter Mla subunit MlaD